MLAYYGSHILHTAVAYFDVVLVEKGVILVLFRKMFRYELKKGFADVSFHVAFKRRIIPPFYTSIDEINTGLSLFTYKWRGKSL